MNLVYHHTTTDGLIGIIGNETLWATDIHFLNDYDEYVAGMEKIFRVCEKSKSVANGGKLAGAINGFYDIISELIKVNIEARTTFIVSFTKTRDNLRQWMSYGKPNSSYSIGFNAEAFKNIRLDEENHYSSELAYAFREVDYESDSTIEPVLNLESVMSHLKEMGQSQSGGLEYARHLVNELMFGCCSIKRNEFEDENESRMLVQTRKVGASFSGMKFRNSGGVITPYINVPIPLSAIHEIIIGPSINKEFAEKGLRKMLQHKEIECKVSHSTCTLRQY